MNRPDNGIVSALVICLVLPSAAGTWWRYSYDFPTPPAQALSGKLETHSMESGGRDRSYSLYVPREVQRPAAVVVAFHGANDAGQKLRAFSGYEFERLADRYGFLVAYPSAFGGNWNDCRKTSKNSLRVDDVGFVRDLSAELHAAYGTGPTYFVGYSDGGEMVYRLALEAPETFTAAAVVSANLPVEKNSECTASMAPVSMAILNGTADSVDPFAGAPGVTQSAEESARYFAGLAGSAGNSHVERLGDVDGDASTWVERRIWPDARGAEVTLLEIHGGGHTIPQRAVRMPRNLGKTSADLDGPAEVWSFFARHPARTSVSAKPQRSPKGNG
jgi:polyhydroxybutyrate depolymerase